MIGEQEIDGQRCDEIHCWISISRDDNEGIIATSLPTGDPDLPIALMPMFSSDKTKAEKFKPRVDAILDHAAKQGIFMKAELRTYVLKK